MQIRGRAVAALKKQQRAEKKKIYLKALGLCVVNALIFSVAALLFLRLPYLKIQNVAITGASAEHASFISDYVKDAFGARKWYAMPHDTILSYPKKLSAEMREQFPWIRVATVEISPSHDLLIKLEEKKPEYLTCVGGEFSENKSCFFADNTGYVFSSAPIFSESIYTELMNVSASTSVQIGTQIFPKKIMEIFAIAESKLGLIGVKTAVFEENSLGGLSVKTKDGWRILFSPDTAVENWVGAVNAIIRSSDFNERYDIKKDKLEYIDVRLVDKVYYKFFQ